MAERAPDPADAAARFPATWIGENADIFARYGTRMLGDWRMARKIAMERIDRVLLAALLFCSTNVTAWAQDTPVFDMSLEELLDVRVVAAASREQRPFDSPRSISVVTAEDLRRGNYRSTPDALQELVGIVVQQTNDGGGSPILRGLIGNQVLLMVDGIRMNNAIYRLGPNQYLNTIDINQIERIEIIRGPGSVLFGSDALGGVVNIITKSRVVGDTRPSAFEVSTRLGSADRGTMGRAAFDGGTNRFSVVGGVSLKFFGQLYGGRGTAQRFTGYDEWAADLRVATKPRTGHALTFSVQHVNQAGVQRADVLQTGTDLEYRWDPESRTLFSGEWATTRPFGFVREAHVIASYQEQAEHIFRMTAAAPTQRRLLHEGDRNLGVRVQLFSVWAVHNLTYGVDLSEDFVRSTRTDKAIATGDLIPARGTYIDGARMTARGGYLQDQVNVTPRLGLDLGVRYSWSDMEAVIDDPTTGRIEIDRHNIGLVESTYGFFKVRESLKLVGGVSTGFRAPNIDDVSARGSFGGGFEVPNPLLEPEHSVNVVVGLKFNDRRTMANVSVFDMFHYDLIARAPATFDDLSFLDTNLNGTRESDEPLVFTRQNVGRARVRGLEADGRLRVANGWTMGGNLAWMSGENLSADQPLSRMPSLHGMVRVLFEPGSRWWVEGYSLFAQDQDRLSDGDIADPRIGPSGTPGFVTINVRGGVVVPWVGTLTLGLENVGDTRYKWHGSGILRPGRNIVVGLRRSF